MHAQLEIVNLPLRPKYLVMPGEFLIIGRSHNADIVFNNDNSVSRLHCKVFYDQKQFWIEDLKSRNQVMVNKTKVEKSVLRDQDELTIGRYEIRFTIIRGKDGSLMLPEHDDFDLMKREDKLTGKIAVKLGLISRDDLRKCVHKQEQISADGPYFPLDEIFTQENLIDQGGMDAIAKFRQGPPYSIPGYDVYELIGMGGMGRIYRARSEKTRELVAIKVFADAPEAFRQQMEDQFRKEAQTLMTLNTATIVRGVEVGETPDCIFIAMEYIDGITLQQKLKDEGGRLLPDDAVRITLQVASALEHAHEHGIVHRDIKPENILITKEQHIKLCDFGLVKDAGQGEKEETVFGTVAYMSPEQIRSDQNLDIHSDIYSLGTVFYRMLFGRIPFVGTNNEIKMKHLNQKVTFPDEGKHKQKMELAKIISQMMEKLPSNRYQTPSELCQDLIAAQGRFQQEEEIGRTEEVTLLKSGSSRLNTTVRLRAQFSWKIWVQQHLFLLAFCLCLFGAGLAGLYWWSQKDNRAYEEIVIMETRKQWSKVEQLSRLFLKNYPGSGYKGNVTFQLQTSLFEQAQENYQNQSYLQALQLCQEIQKLEVIDSPIEKEVQSFEKMIEEKIRALNRERLWQKRLGDIEQQLNQNLLSSAENLLSDAKSSIQSREEQQSWDALEERLETLKLKRKLQSYRYYIASDLNQIRRLQNNVSNLDTSYFIQSLFLTPKEKKSIQKGYFLTKGPSHLHCISVTNGEVYWSEKILGTGKVSWQILRDYEVVDTGQGNQAFVYSIGGRFCKLINLATGQVIWQNQLPTVLTSEPTFYGKKIFLGCEDGHCYQISSIRGKWEGAFKAEERILSLAKISPGFPILYVADESQHIYGFDLSSNSLVSYFRFTGELQGRIHFYYPNIFVATQEEENIYLRMYDHKINVFSDSAKRSKKLFSFPENSLSNIIFGRQKMVMIGDKKLGVLNLVSPESNNLQILDVPFPIVQAQLVYQENYLLAIGKEVGLVHLDPKSMQKVLWKFPNLIPGTPVQNWQSMGKFYFTATWDRGRIRCFNFKVEESGVQELWQKQLGAPFTDALLVGDYLWLASNNRECFWVSLKRKSKPVYKTVRGKGNTKAIVDLNSKSRIALINSQGISRMMHPVQAKPYRKWRLSEKFRKSLVGASSFSGQAIITTQKKFVKVFLVKNGRRLCGWKAPGQETLTSEPLFHKGSIFVGGTNGLHQLLLRKKGKRYQLRYRRTFPSKSVTASSVVTNESVIFGDEVGNIQAFSLATGKQLWQHKSQGAVVSQPLVYRNIVYFGNERGEVLAIHQGGELLWKLQLQGSIMASPLIHEGRVFVLSNLGELVELQPITGRKMSETKLHGKMGKVFLTHGKSFLIGTEEGFLNIVERIQ